MNPFNPQYSLKNAAFRRSFRGPYTIEFTVERFGYYGGVAQVLTHNRNNVAWLMGYVGNVECGFHVIGKYEHDVSPEARTMALAVLEPGRRHRATVYVRKNSIAASLDGTLVAHYDTDGSDLSVKAEWWTDPSPLGIATANSMVFHKIEIGEVTGEGKVIVPGEEQQQPPPEAKTAPPVRSETKSLTGR